MKLEKIRNNLKKFNPLLVFLLVKIKNICMDKTTTSTIFINEPLLITEVQTPETSIESTNFYTRLVSFINSFLNNTQTVIFQAISFFGIAVQLAIKQFVKAYSTSLRFLYHLQPYFSPFYNFLQRSLKPFYFRFNNFRVQHIMGFWVKYMSWWNVFKRFFHR